MSEQSSEVIAPQEQSVLQSIREVTTTSPEFFANLAQQYIEGADANEFIQEVADRALEKFFPDELEACGQDRAALANLRESVIGGLIASYVGKDSLIAFSDESGIDTEAFETQEFSLMLIQSMAEFAEDTDVDPEQYPEI